ncbi:MAG: hypothetical protein D6717_10270, partial [Gammaproteobacteria bacterium]
MPYLHVHTNVQIEDEAGFMQRCSQTAAEALGKPESYVMVNLSHGKPMLFAGSDAPLAYVELKSLGMPGSATAELSATLCGMLEDALGIEPGRVY